jgi:hypothetical protein
MSRLTLAPPERAHDRAYQAIIDAATPCAEAVVHRDLRRFGTFACSPYSSSYLGERRCTRLSAQLPQSDAELIESPRIMHDGTISHAWVSGHAVRDRSG